jgi:2-iminobutanoate/2-iminopropanoate deaminase
VTHESISTEAAPIPKGPYSQGIKVGKFVFVSGQGPFDPKTGQPVALDIESQTRQTLQNIKAILESAGYSMADVVNTTVFLKDVSDFQRMNETYANFFEKNPPARTTTRADFIIRGILVTIDAIAYRD